MFQILWTTDTFEAAVHHNGQSGAQDIALLHTVRTCHLHTISSISFVFNVKYLCEVNSTDLWSRIAF